MNGGVNGTMEEPMDTSLPSSPEPVKAIDAKGQNYIGSETSNSSDKCNSNRESNQGIVSNSNLEMSEEPIEKCDDQLSKDSEKSTAEAVHSEDAISNQCRNNNENKKSAPEEIDNVKETMDLKKKDETVQEVQMVDSKEEYVDELDDSSDDDSVMSSEQRGDTISMNSSDAEELDDTSQESQAKSKDGDVINLDNYNDDQNGDFDDSRSPDIQEILSDNDDCIIENDDKSNTSSENKSRRKSETRSTNVLDDIENGNFDESDIEEVEMEDPLDCNSKPIVIKDTKTLVEMAAKHKTNNNNQKEPTIVIIDTKSGKGSTTNTTSKATAPSTSTAMTAQNLYQSIVARGTTVTPVAPVGSKSAAATQSSQNSQSMILPTLTDDMFVVEVPSFIVPYVYEKPSIKDFREFVDKLGKELEEQKAKEEQEKLEKEKQEKEKRDLAKKLQRERGEEVIDSEDESVNKTNDSVNRTNETEDDESKKKKSKKDRKRKRNDDDDASWDGESSSESDEETLSDDDTVVLKDKMDSIEDIKDVTNISAEKISTSKSDNYFDCSLGKFFKTIGLNLVQEYVQHDLLKQQNRKLYREKKAGHSTKAVESSIVSLTKNLEFSKENNAPYTFPQKKCEFCSFKTESDIVLSHHLETPHMKNNVYKCNFCTFEIRSPHDILFHMEAEHNVRGKLERAPAYHQCPNCPFEDNGKGKLARHLIACAKKFKPDLNLAPPIEWEPPAKIPKIASARNTINSYQNAFNRQVNLAKSAMNINNLMGAAGGYRPRGRSPMGAPPRSAPVHGAPLVRGGLMMRHNAPATAHAPALMGPNYPVANNGKPKSMHQPSISITPLPRQPQPPPQVQQTKNTFVICEICDGYIKDLEQLRNHMQWIHKVKIHPKMIYNRPPLNCQKCQFRFFTDQGLERHLLGSHGLVTSSMQEAANKGKDAGRCPVCGRVYQWKLLSHVAKDHHLTLKPAHLSYKCTVCTATFGMYKQFENHVYSAHSVVAKRVMDKSKPVAPPKPNDPLLKPLKINDEITIIPQPVKPTTSAKGK